MQATLATVCRSDSEQTCPASADDRAQLAHESNDDSDCPRPPLAWLQADSHAGSTPVEQNMGILDEHEAYSEQKLEQSPATEGELEQPMARIASAAAVRHFASIIWGSPS